MRSDSRFTPPHLDRHCDVFVLLREPWRAVLVQYPTYEAKLKGVATRFRQARSCQASVKKCCMALDVMHRFDEAGHVHAHAHPHGHPHAHEAVKQQEEKSDDGWGEDEEAEEVVVPHRSFTARTSQLDWLRRRAPPRAAL